MSLKKLKPVLAILDSPYENWSNPLVSDLFQKMVALKKSGYDSNYTESVLPVDTTDFIATHVLLCLRDNETNLSPVMGYKTTSLNTCLKHNLIFPGLGLVRSANGPLHCRVVEQIVDRCQKTETGLAYLGSWTVDHDFKVKHQEIKAELRELFHFIYNSVYQMQNITEVIIGGTLRFKTEKIFQELGHEPLQLEGKTLPPIHVAHLAKEPVLVMHSQKLVPTPLGIAEKWASLWDNRIHVNSATAIKRLQKAA